MQGPAGSRGWGAVKDRAVQLLVGWEGTWCFLWVDVTSFWEVRYSEPSWLGGDGQSGVSG